MTAEEALEEIIRLCAANKVEEAYLYGSRAKGTEHERSDIDIAVKGAGCFEELQEQIEEIPTLYTVDLLDLDCCSNKYLLEDIQIYGRKIYPAVSQLL